MESINALRARHSALAKETRDLVEKNNATWNADLQAKYDQGIGQMDDIKAQIDRLESVLAADKDNAVQAKIDEHKERGIRATGRDLFAKWLKHGDKSITAEEWTEIRNTMSVGGTSSEGGYTVPTEVANSVIEVLKKFGGMREVATVISTAGGNPLNYPTSDGTSEVGEIIGENTTATSQDPSFGVVTIGAYKYSSKIVAVPFELLQDSAVDVEAFIANRIGTRLGRITNTHFTTGSGSGQPKGIVTAASSGKVGASGQTGTIIFDDLVDLVHSVDPAYRAGNCRFMLNDASLKVIRKIKDSQGRPIFLPGYDGLGQAMPDTILGYGVTINQDVATMAANAKSVLFGDFSRYVIRDVMGMTLFRFTDSAYTKLGQVGFLAWMRADGNLIDAGAPVKYYANAAS